MIHLSVNIAVFVSHFREVMTHSSYILEHNMIVRLHTVACSVLGHYLNQYSELFSIEPWVTKISWNLNHKYRKFIYWKCI